MSAQPQRRLSPQEYLAIERKSSAKHEYYRGELFAMSGASRYHNLISGNCYASLHSQLSNRACEVYANDMRVKVSRTGLYTYPDVAVTCQKPHFEDEVFDTLVNPQVIIEVLSDSTESYDRGKKFEQYRDIEALREYLLITQDRPHVDHFKRGGDGVWSLGDATGLHAEVHLPTIDCLLRLADVYAKVEFPPPSAEADRAAGLYRDDKPR
jgi:Uma2 family endonuclease